jgi:amino acid transporter
MEYDKEDPKYGGHGSEEETVNPEFNLAQQHDQLERGLKSRHIQFLALGKSSYHNCCCH